MNIVTPANIVGCLAAALVNATDLQRASICSYLNCTPAALIQGPGSGPTLPTAAPGLGQSPFFILDGAPPVLYIWNGSGYVPASAFAAIVNAVISLDPAVVIAAICGATANAINPLLPIRAIQAGAGGACSVIELAIIKDCDGNVATTAVSCARFNQFVDDVGVTIGALNTKINNLINSVPSGSTLPLSPAAGSLPFFVVPNPAIPGAQFLYVWSSLGGDPTSWHLAGDGVGAGGGAGGLTAVSANSFFTGNGTSASQLGLNIAEVCAALAASGCSLGGGVSFSGAPNAANTAAQFAVSAYSLPVTVAFQSTTDNFASVTTNNIASTALGGAPAGGGVAAILTLPDNISGVGLTAWARYSLDGGATWSAWVPSQHPNNSI